MNREAGSGGEGADVPGDLPSGAFLDELSEFFRRRSPAGTPRWEFEESVDRLEEARASAMAGFTRFLAGEEGGAGDTPEADGRDDGGRSVRRVARAAARPARARLDREVGRVVGPLRDHVAVNEENNRRIWEALSDILRHVERRLVDLETAVEKLTSPVPGMAWHRPEVEIAAWSDAIVEALVGPSSGRPIVHTECGRGELLAALAAAGGSAIGVDTRGTLAWDAAAAGYDVVLRESAAYFGSGDCPELGGVVVSGVCDRLPVAAKVELVESAVRRLRAGSTMAVVGSDPRAWSEGLAAAEADLAPGRPLYGETWAFLLARAGLEEVGVAGEPVEPSSPGCVPTVLVLGRMP